MHGSGAGRLSPARILYAATCCFASIQFVWLYLSRISSALDLPAYEHGLERTPFQYRMLLSTPLRWVHNNHCFQVLAESLSRLPAWFPQRVLPEDLLQAGIDLTSVLTASAAAFILYGRVSRYKLLGWLIWPLVLVLCFITYTGSTHHALRFPYDLPSMAFFSVGLCFIHAEKRGWTLGVFAIATLNRETTLLLILLLFIADKVRSVPLRKTLAQAFPMGIFWLILHLFLVHRFAANPSVSGPRLWLNLGSILIPLSWPQLFSALGYLGPFLILFHRSIPDLVLRRWLQASWVWVVCMLLYGLLVEVRIFGELIPCAACIAALVAEEQLVLRLGKRNGPPNPVSQYVQVAGRP